MKVPLILEHPQAVGDYPTYGYRPGRSWGLLLSVSMILIVCIRFFSEELGVVPGIIQLIDVPLAILVAFLAVLAFVRRGASNDGLRLRLILYLFLMLFLVSTLVNAGRVSMVPAVMFFFGFASPLIFAAATMNARLERPDVELIVRTFFWLGVLQLAVGVLYDVPRFLASGNPDVVSGTFGQNPYQFTYFLGLWLLYVLGGTVVKSGSVSRWRNIGIVVAALAVFGLFYAAQYRAMIIFFTLVILFAFWVSPAKVSRRVFTTIVIAGVSVMALIVVGTAFPNLKLFKVFDLFQDTTPLVESGKVAALRNTAAMYADIPHTAVVGSGGGTFSSRAYVTFAETADTSEGAAGPLSAYVMGGRKYMTDVSARYIQTIPRVAIQGGNTAASYQSSYTSLAAESGILGLLVYLGAYVFALVFSYRRLLASAKAGDGLGVRLAFVCLGGILLLLIQALFDNWLETTRVTIPLWILIAALYVLKILPAPETAEATGPKRPPPDRWPAR